MVGGGVRQQLLIHHGRGSVYFYHHDLIFFSTFILMSLKLHYYIAAIIVIIIIGVVDIGFQADEYRVTYFNSYASDSPSIITFCQGFPTHTHNLFEVWYYRMETFS